jgi:hypothetical protein
VPALAVAGAGWVLALSTFNVTVQLSAPRWVVARALSLYQMAAFGGMALGAALFGRIASAQDVQTALLVAAGVQVLTIVAGLVMPLPAARDLNLALRDWPEPETQVSVDDRSGPIVITIEYRIADTDIPRFLNVMHERRRIRRRDGALLRAPQPAAHARRCAEHRGYPGAPQGNRTARGSAQDRTPDEHVAGPAGPVAARDGRSDDRHGAAELSYRPSLIPAHTVRGVP